MKRQKQLSVEQHIEVANGLWELREKMVHLAQVMSQTYGRASGQAAQFWQVANQIEELQSLMEQCLCEEHSFSFEEALKFYDPQIAALLQSSDLEPDRS